MFTVFRVQSGEKSIHAVGWKLFAFNRWRNDFHHHWILTVSVLIAVAVTVEKTFKTEMCAGFYAVFRKANSIVWEISIFCIICSHSFCVLGLYFSPIILCCLFAFLFFGFDAALCCLMLSLVCIFPLVPCSFVFEHRKITSTKFHFMFSISCSTNLNFKLIELRIFTKTKNPGETLLRTGNFIVRSFMFQLIMVPGPKRYIVQLAFAKERKGREIN